MRNFIREYSFCFFAGALTILFFLLRFCYAGFTGEENRYASVSWQMYQQGTWLIPHLGFDVYPDKPPLTYWLNILGWHVNAAWTWPLIIPAIFTIGNFFLTQNIYFTFLYIISLKRECGLRPAWTSCLFAQSEI